MGGCVFFAGFCFGGGGGGGGGEGGGGADDGDGSIAFGGDRSLGFRCIRVLSDDFTAASMSAAIRFTFAILSGSGVVFLDLSKLWSKISSQKVTRTKVLNMHHAFLRKSAQKGSSRQKIRRRKSNKGIVEPDRERVF